MYGYALGRYAYQRKKNPYHNHATGRFSTAPGGGTGKTIGPESSNYVEGVNDSHIMKLSKGVFSSAVAHDTKVTKELKGIVKEADNGGTLEGLDFRVKSDASMRRKIVSDAKEKMIPPEEAASQIRDALRYTAILPPDGRKFHDAVNSQLEKLKAAGYTVTKLKNTWQSDGYKGINSAMTTKDGYEFELQFHTPQSFAAKERAHKIYDDARRVPAGSKESLAYQEQMKKIFDAVPIPEGAATITK